MIIMSRKDELPVQSIKSFDEYVYMNGKYILDFPDCIEIGAELGANNPFDLNTLVSDIEGKFLEAYPSYDFLIYEPLLDSSNVFDDSALFPKETGHIPSRLRVGETPNVACIPKRGSQGRNGLAITQNIDLTSLTSDGLGRETFLLYWRVVRKGVQHDTTPVALSGYAGATKNESAVVRYVEANPSEYSVYISENDGNTYERIERLTPFSFDQRTESVRLAFVNDSSVNDLYVLSYALMF